MSSTNEGWDGDVLNRKSSADYLTKFMQSRYQARPKDKGFVLAINAEWGYGKTFMLNNWKDDLVFLGHPTVYFDAWKNDFTEELLIAFISELDDSLRPQFKNIPIAQRLLKEVLNNADGVITTTLKTVGKGLTKKIVGVAIEELQEAISEQKDTKEEGEESAQKKSSHDLSKELKKIFDVELRTHKSRKSSIKNFIDKLNQLIEALTKKENVQLPLFIFVDELDRCRPDYALQLLEAIKHLFGVPGVYFVVATNLTQLSESVKAVYGGGFAGQDYPKYFFDLEYGLPEPNNDDFARHLFSEMSMHDDSKFKVGLTKRNGRYNYIEIFSLFATAFGLGLRDQQRVFKIIEAAMFSLDKKVHILFLYFLAMLYYKSNVVFDQVMAKGKITEEYKEFMRKIPKSSLGILVQFFSSGTRKDTEVTVPDIGNIYMQLKDTDLVTVMRENNNRVGGWEQAIREDLVSEIGNSFSLDEPRIPSIKRYPLMIRQAGDFL